MTTAAGLDMASGSQPRLAPGMLVRYTYPYGEPEKTLGIIDELLDWEVRVVTLADAGQTVSSIWPDDAATPIEQIEYGEHEEAQALLVAHAASWRDKVSWLDSALSQAKADQAQVEIRALEAEEKITSMREYAIERHRAGDICRDGLNDFLRYHDLPEYPQHRSATVRVEFDVRLPYCDDSEADARVRDYVTVGTEDENMVEITSAPRDVMVDDLEDDDT